MKLKVRVAFTSGTGAPQPEPSEDFAAGARTHAPAGRPDGHQQCGADAWSHRGNRSIAKFGEKIEGVPNRLHMAEGALTTEMSG
jgi:hypothetical protein